MPRRPSRSVPTVIVPGWQGSGEGHWQTWLAGELSEAGREVRHPDFADLDRPEIGQWLHALRSSLDGLPDDGFDVVTHSLGAVLWLWHARATRMPTPPRPARVALVAPPSPTNDNPELDGFFPMRLDLDSVRDAVRQAADGTVLVGGSDDPHCPEGIAEAYGRPLKMATTVIEAGGHLNTESGFGEWPAVLDWCRRDALAFY